MHVAMLVMSEHFEGKGIMVNRKDETRTKQQQKQVKKIIHFHGAEVGVDKFELKGLHSYLELQGCWLSPVRRTSSTYFETRIQHDRHVGEAS